MCKRYHTCQLTTKIYPKIGYLLVKIVEEGPWDALCVDLIGPYILERKCKYKNGKKKKDLILCCVAMIDPVTSWFEIAKIGIKRADSRANEVETTWLTRYPYPTQVVLYRGKEFMAEFSEMTLKDDRVKKKPITVRNQQANIIIERIHQTIRNMI
eukprot:7740857-Ditylum_brightwellii.AAC.1